MSQTDRDRIRDWLDNLKCDARLRRRERAFSRQRKSRGWDDSDLWGLDTTIAAFLAPRLRRFAEMTCSYPGGELTYEKWMEIVGKMADTFELIAEEKHERDESPYGLKDGIEEGLDLFRKYFFHLWD